MQGSTPDQTGPKLLAVLSAAEQATLQAYLTERQLPAGAELWQVGA